MAVKTTAKYWCEHAHGYHQELICDTDADVENLPKCCAGSTAIVVESGKIFMVNASGEWAPFGEA